MIVVIKLSTGEEMIAYYESVTCKYSKPRVIQVMQTQQGVQAALVPWFISNPDASFNIDASHIIAQIEAPKEVADMYLAQTSGIDLSASRIQI